MYRNAGARTHFLYSFINRQTLRLFSYFSNLWIMLLWTWEYKYLFGIMILFPLKLYQKWDCQIIWYFYFSLIEKPQYCFFQFTFLPTMYKSSFSPRLQSIFLLSFFDNGYLNKCKVIVFFTCIPWWLMMLEFFMYLLAICMFSLKNAYLGHLKRKLLWN